KTNVVTTSYVSPAMRELDAAAKEAGIIVLNEIGLDPGIDHLYAIKTIDEVHAKGGKIKKFFSYCGGLPAPQFADNPLGYKFSWSSRGVLLALLNNASYIENGKTASISGQQLMTTAQPYYISPAYAFVAYPNRDSTPFREFYRINSEGEGETVVRGTLRYQGFPAFVKLLVDLGWLDTTSKEWLSNDLSWIQVMSRVLGVDPTEKAVLDKIISVANFPSDSEKERIVSGLRWLGLFSSEAIVPRPANNPTLLDTLCARLEKLMAYAPGERDLLMLQHKFVVQYRDGKQETITSTPGTYGAPQALGSCHGFTVGLPRGYATPLVLDGKF
ncbi:hypothetical protein MPER_05283, partial [Moniliophthora perniciosa FA553]